MEHLPAHLVGDKNCLLAASQGEGSGGTCAGGQEMFCQDSDELIPDLPMSIRGLRLSMQDHQGASY